MRPDLKYCLRKVFKWLYRDSGFILPKKHCKTSCNDFSLHFNRPEEKNELIYYHSLFCAVFTAHQSQMILSLETKQIYTYSTATLKKGCYEDYLSFLQLADK